MEENLLIFLCVLPSTLNRRRSWGSRKCFDVDARHVTLLHYRFQFSPSCVSSLLFFSRHINVNDSSAASVADLALRFELVNLIWFILHFVSSNQIYLNLFGNCLNVEVLHNSQYRQFQLPAEWEWRRKIVSAWFDYFNCGFKNLHCCSMTEYLLIKISTLTRCAEKNSSDEEEKVSEFNVVCSAF